jgi:RecA/RadA recombinase
MTFTKLAADIDETEQYVDTGSYIFNGLVSGSIFGGVSGNKITAIAGESSTGKTFFSLAVVKNFLDSNPDGYCLYFDTEAAVNKISYRKSWVLTLIDWLLSMLLQLKSFVAKHLRQ